MLFALWLVGAGAIAVAAGLVFVGLEVRKLRVAVMADATSTLAVAKNLGQTPVGEAVRAVAQGSTGRAYNL